MNYPEYNQTSYELVSVIITTYKRSPNILSRAIKSAIQQTYRPLEIIVINDYPENKERSECIMTMLNEYDSDVQVDYYEMDKNSGACVARNTGLSYANGDYIAFLDDDDIWEPEKIFLQMEEMKNNNENILVTGLVRIISGKQQWFYNSKQRYSGQVLDKLLAGNYVGGCSVPLIKKSALKQVGGFDTRYSSSQDLNLWLKLSKIGNFGFVDRVLINYTVSDDGITSNYKNRLQGWSLLLNDFQHDFDHYKSSKQIFLMSISEELRKKGDDKLARKYREMAIECNAITLDYVILCCRRYIPSGIVSIVRYFRVMLLPTRFCL